MVDPDTGEEMSPGQPGELIVKGPQVMIGYGLVETGVGLIPAGGGCKELVLMTSNRYPDKESDLQPEINRIFEMVALAKASTSGHEAIRMGYGRSGDSVVMNQDYRIYEAKQAVLAMDRAGHSGKS